MSKAEILAELPNLKPEELVEIRARLDELTGDHWIDNGTLSDEDKAALDAALAEYEANPNAGKSWDEVEAEILAKFQ